MDLKLHKGEHLIFLGFVFIFYRLNHLISFHKQIYSFSKLVAVGTENWFCVENTMTGQSTKDGIYQA